MPSFFNLLTAGLACVIPLTAAYTTPVGDSPSGNPISQPGLNSVVPAGKSFSVTWQPTTKGTVSLVLLKGPSDNAVPQYAIAEKIPNNGIYAWQVSSDLAPTSDATGYGIQLIDDSTGAYQYTTQFGISNDNYVSSASSSAPATTSSAAWGPSGVPHDPGPVSGSWTDSWSDSWSTSSWTTSASSSSKLALNSTAPYVTAPGGPIATGISPSGVPSGKANVTMVAPTGAVPSSSSLLTATATSGSSSSGSATRSSSTAVPTQSNAAVSVATSFAGLVFAGAVAVFAL